MVLKFVFEFCFDVLYSSWSISVRWMMLVLDCHSNIRDGRNAFSSGARTCVRIFSWICYV